MRNREVPHLLFLSCWHICLSSDLWLRSAFIIKNILPIQFYIVDLSRY